MKTILCPVDFSENSIKAAEMAAIVSSKTKAVLYIIHKFTLTGGEDVTVTEDIFNNSKAAADERLEQLKRTLLAKFENLIVNTTSLYGVEVHQVILDYSDDIKADLIIMGTKGAGGFKEILFGTTATAVASSSEIPVLVFPLYAKPQLPDTLVYATDLKGEEQDLLEPILQFSYDLDADITFLHVSLDEKKGKNLIEEKLSQAINGAQVIEKLKVQFAEVRSADVFGAIQDFAKDINAGLIVLGDHQKGYIEKLRKGDLTRLMSMYTKVPLLIIHKRK